MSTLSASEDAALVARARGGSREAAGELFSRHWLSAWRAARALTGSHQAAEDVVQDAFERAFRALERFEEGSFAAWLHRIVVNRALDVVRAERPSLDLEAAGGLQARADHARLADTDFLAAVACLVQERRVVVVLRYGLDYTLSQIAEFLNVPLGTVQSRLHRALAELRSQLEVHDGG
jgi:RNA polymerase sigma-70 factor (ECF subfamily)